MPARKRSRLTLAERGLKGRTSVSAPPTEADLIDQAWNDHHASEVIRRADQISARQHRMHAYTIHEQP